MIAIKDSAKIVCLMIFSGLMLLLCSCSGNAALTYKTEMEALQVQVDELQTTICRLESVVDSLEAANAGTMSYLVNAG